jgi:3-methylfumaryl-CoA hydratase
MWAGSTVDFLKPIPVGAEISRLSRVVKIEEKEGRSGTLVFAAVEHEWAADGAPAVREVQSLVYREAPSGPSASVELPADRGEWDAVQEFAPDAPLLFRYSALTFNTHRIHYDADYVRDIEHYPGLVVHGPLTATRLLLLAARELGGQALARFAFRALSPAYAGETVTLGLRRAGERMEFAAFARSGPHGSRRIMEASGVVA